MWRAIIYGCIPVTYYRALELPFMRRLGIDYGQFSINIQPDDYDTTQVHRCSLCNTNSVDRAQGAAILLAAVEHAALAIMLPLLIC